MTSLQNIAILVIQGFLSVIEIKNFDNDDRTAKH